MRRLFLIFAALFAAAPVRAATVAVPNGTSVAALSGDTSPAASYYMSPVSFNMMEPFMTEKMRENLRPAGTYRAPNPAESWARMSTGSGITPASAYARGRSDSATFQARQANNQQSTVNSPAVSQARRVVPRTGATNAARVATGGAPNAARSATVAEPMGSLMPITPASAGGGRRVVARSSARGDTSVYNQSFTAANQAASTVLPSNFTPEQCLADYTNCMNGYCKRANTRYNRCYCSPKLAQIDAQYQPAINSALEQIMYLQNGGLMPPEGMTDAELEQFWQDTFAEYAGGVNNLAALNEALNIDWADTESRARGQNAFATGHDYCMQHLRGCFFMAGNLRDIYRSEIARDCASYEKFLNNMKIVAESAVRQLKGS